MAIFISLGILAESDFYPLPTWTNRPFHSSSVPLSTLLLSLIASFASLKNLSSKLLTLNPTNSDLLRTTGSSQMFINNGFNKKRRASGFYFFSIWSFPFSFGCCQLNKQGSCIFIILLRKARCSVTSVAGILGNCTFHVQAGWLCDGWFPGLFLLCFLLFLFLQPTACCCSSCKMSDILKAGTKHLKRVGAQEGEKPFK